jgi:hypothetical protein
VHPRHAILIAAGLLFVIAAWVPYGREALYPLTLFNTWVHEMGHGITAIFVGGSFESLEIFGNASGLAHCRSASGWPHALVSLGGLLAPPILASILIATVHGPRRARVALGVLAVALVVSLAIYVRSTAGLIAMPIVALLLGWAASFGFRAKPERRVILVQALAVVLAFDTVFGMVWYVFQSKVTIDGKVRNSDIQNVADNLGGHYVLWGIGVTIVALGMIGASLWWAWRRPTAPASASGTSRLRPGTRR